MGLDPSTLVRSVVSLERRDLARRGRYPHDRRRHPITITKTGLELVEAVPVIVPEDLTFQALESIGNVVLYPLLIFSGSMVPLEVMPDMVLTISRYLPLAHLVALLQGLWLGAGWGELLTEAAVLAGMAIVGTVIVARTFRWE